MTVSQLHSNHIILIILWLSYFSIHSLFASLLLKKYMLNAFPRIMPWYRLLFNLLAVLLLIPPIVLMYMYPGEIVWQWSGGWRYFADILALLSLAGFIWSLKSYDSAEFLGTRQLQENRKDTSDGEIFKISVFHRYVRHPWYTFALILIWTRDMNVSYLISAILLSLYFILGSRLEEKKLVVFHGDRYRLYRKYVAALVPLPWRFLSKEKLAEIVAVDDVRESNKCQD